MRACEGIILGPSIEERLNHGTDNNLCSYPRRGHSCNASPHRIYYLWNERWRCAFITWLRSPETQ